MSSLCSLLKHLPTPILWPQEYKGREADSESVGQVLAGADVLNSALGCKTSSKQQISSKTHGFKKLRGNCLFGLRTVSEPHEKAGSFPWPQVWQAPSRSLLMYSGLTQLKDRSLGKHGQLHYVGQGPFCCEQIKSYSACLPCALRESRNPLRV